MKKSLAIVSFTILLTALQAETARASTLPHGFGKATWGMTIAEVVSSYQIILAPPMTPKSEGRWAVVGPAPGELTVSGEMLGESDIRSVSFGFHPEYGLTLIHVRFKDMNSPSHLETLLPKWTTRFGRPKEQKEELEGPKVIWEDDVTHVELTYHTVSPRHPTPSDHMALVLWSLPLMGKIESEGGLVHTPDVEKLVPQEEPHKDE